LYAMAEFRYLRLNTLYFHKGLDHIFKDHYFLVYQDPQENWNHFGEF
jgi:hypothetical protein